MDVDLTRTLAKGLVGLAAGAVATKVLGAKAGTATGALFILVAHVVFDAPTERVLADAVRPR